MHKTVSAILFAVSLVASGSADASELVVIGYKGLPPLDAQTIQKLFTGRVVEISGVAVSVVNTVPGSAARNRFLRVYLDQDEEKYTAYWTVRQFIGKGHPPKELQSTAEVIEFVQSQPGAIGYIEGKDLVPGLNVLSKR